MRGRARRERPETSLVEGYFAHWMICGWEVEASLEGKYWGGPFQYKCLVFTVLLTSSFQGFGEKVPPSDVLGVILAAAPSSE